uniref:NADH-ubiquinone oxidoreductase chain 4 n=1 Tax=Selenops bursarius TaxID=881841 RepID=A0A0U1XA32_9ARAC|nr:NADH dehydrogenase subunit 4 [Selenops bursarius]AIM52660.1 NADH dehydrogenase subunit 4 [Selenops bursarius]
MMKMILPTLTIALFTNNFPIMITIMSMMLMLNLLLTSNIKFFLINTTMHIDTLSSMMIMLTLISVMLIIISSNMIKEISKTIIPILIILTLTFSVSNMLNFYILFEIVLIPTMILITLSGKQPERLQASIYLIIYTLTASLPLLTSIIYMKNNPSFLISNILMMKFNLITFMTLAFLVKMPMYFTHLWLPKAHVEAPLEGSMILAAVLLKLGGYGLLRFLPICIKSINKMNYWIISISLIGASATSLNCIRQKDLKSLIAYSSVAHMGLVLVGIFSSNYIGITGAVMMMIAHGLSSSALFLLVNDLYSKYHSRNILSFKGLITLIPNITFWWFMFMAINISAPPSINTISEIFLMSSMIYWNQYSMIMIFMVSLMTASFSMSLFVNLSHNKNELMSSYNTQQKIFLSLFIHLIPLILILMKMEMMLM